MAKNGQVHGGGKVARSSATPTKPFSVHFYDLKSISIKFGDDIFITFEMLRSYINYNNILENLISLLFRPSVIRGPCSIDHN